MNESKNARLYAIIAAVGFAAYTAVSMWSSVTSETYSIDWQTVFWWMVYICFAVLLLVGKKNSGFLILAGAEVYHSIYAMIHYVHIVNMLWIIVGVAWFALLLINVIPSMSQHAGITKMLWFVPGVLCFATYICVGVYSQYFDYLSKAWFWSWMLFVVARCVGYLLTGLWLKETIVEPNMVETDAVPYKEPYIRKNFMENERTIIYGVPKKNKVALIIFIVGLTLMIISLPVANYVYIWGIALSIAGYAIKAYTENCEITVNTHSVFGDLPNSGYIKIPLNEITSLNRCAFDGIAIGSTTGVNNFYCFENRDEVLNAISDVLTNPQKYVVQPPAPTVVNTLTKTSDEPGQMKKVKDVLGTDILPQQKQHAASSARPKSKAMTEIADEIEKLKTLKKLLDAGILTQEEFDEKKKQILGM